MRWDASLAAKAQELADTHVYKHDSYADRANPKYSFVGQNLYMGFSSWEKSSLDYAGAVKLWYDEVSLSEYDIMSTHSI